MNHFKRWMDDALDVFLRFHDSVQISTIKVASRCADMRKVQTFDDEKLLSYVDQPAILDTSQNVVFERDRFEDLTEGFFIRSVRCRGDAKDFDVRVSREVVDYLPVSVRGGMMGFVDDDHAKVMGFEPGHSRA